MKRGATHRWVCSGPRRSRGPTYQDRAPERAGQAAGGSAGDRRRRRPASAVAATETRQRPLRPGPDRRPGGGWRDRSRSSRVAALPRPGRPRPGCRRASAPSGGRRNWPRSRSGGAAVAGADVGHLGPVHRRDHLARRHPPHDGLVGAGAGLAPAEGAEVVACRAGRRRRRPWRGGPGGRGRARPSGPAADRAPARSTPGSGSGRPWPSGGRRTRRAPRWPRARRWRGRAGG